MNKIARYLVTGIAGITLTSAASASVCSIPDVGSQHVDVKNKSSQFAIWDTDTEHSQFYGGGGTSYGGSSFNKGRGASSFKAFIADELTGDGDSNAYGEIEVSIVDTDKVYIFLPGSQGTTDTILAVGSLVEEALNDGASVHVDVKNKSSQFAIWDTDSEKSQFHGGGATSFTGSSFSLGNHHGRGNFNAFIAAMITGDGDSNQWGEIEIDILGSDTVMIYLPGSRGTTDVIMATGSYVAAALDSAAGVHVDVKNKHSQFAIWDTDTEHRQFYGGNGTPYGGSSLNRKRGAKNVRALVDELVNGENGVWNRYGEIGIDILGCGEFVLYLPASRGTTDTISVIGWLAKDAILSADALPGYYGPVEE